MITLMPAMEKSLAFWLPVWQKKDANAIPQSILCYQHCHQTDSKHLTQQHPHLPTQGRHQSQRQWRWHPIGWLYGTTPNQEWWDNDKLLLANPKQGYMVNSQITNGLFMKACMEICHGLDNFTANATIATQAHKEVIANEGQFYPEQCIKFIGKQPTLFLFLAITGPNNQVVVLHLGYTTLRSLFASIYKTKICWNKGGIPLVLSVVWLVFWFIVLAHHCWTTNCV